MSKALQDFRYGSDEMNQCPYASYKALRDESPVYRIPGTDTYMLTRYEDQMAMFLDAETYSNARPWERPSHPLVQKELDKGWPAHHLLSGSDAPMHTRLRNITNRAFSQRRIRELEVRIRAIAQELVDKFKRDGHVEFMAQYAAPLPLMIIAGMLGVSREDLPKIHRWSESIVAVSAGGLPLEEEIAATRDLVEFQHYLKAQIDVRKKVPHEDFIGDMIAARTPEGEPLDDENLIDLSRLLLAAGHETTMQLIGNMMYILVHRPEDIVRLQAEPTLMENYIEEAMRFESPVVSVSRVTTCDVEIGGVKLPKGSRILPMLGAANRDERHFADPDRFDPEREDASTHLAFGWGSHMCLGRPLARLEALVSLQTLLPQLPNLRLAPGANDFRWRSVPTRRGLVELNLVFDPA